jgi:hypothetical protein
MKQPKLVSATQAELDELLALARAASFPQEKYQLLEGVLGTFVQVMQVLQNTKSSLRRFRQMLFGARTENKRHVLKENDADQQGQNANSTPASPGDQPPQDRPNEIKSKHPGHGRNGVQAYRGATVVALEHPSCSRATGARSARPARSMRMNPGRSYESWASHR